MKFTKITFFAMAIFGLVANTSIAASALIDTISPTTSIIAGEFFTIRVTSAMDVNVRTDYNSIPNSSFEIGTTPPSTTSLWSIPTKSGANVDANFLSCSSLGYSSCDGTYGFLSKGRNNQSPGIVRAWVCRADGLATGQNIATYGSKCQLIATAPGSQTMASIDFNNLSGDSGDGNYVVQIVETYDAFTGINSIKWFTTLENSSFTITDNIHLRFLHGELLNGSNPPTRDQFIMIDNLTYDDLNTIGVDVNAYCKISFNNSPFQSMALNVDTNLNSATLMAPTIAGDYNYGVSCAYHIPGDGNISDYDEGHLTVVAPPKSELRGSLCKPIVYNGSSKNKIDVVFVGSGFTDVNTWANTVPDFISYDGAGYGLMSVPPFNNDNNKTLFNFWRVDELETINSLSITGDTSKLAYDDCPFANQVVLLAVEPRFNSFSPVISYYPQAQVFIGKEYLQNCKQGQPNCTYPWPLDIPLTILPDSACIGTGDEPQCKPMGSNRNEVVRTFVHEFGHSFGGLIDEYVADIPILPPWYDPPNCASSVPACSKWSDVPDATCGDYNDGCFFADWIRPYDNTIMNKQYRQFLPFVHYDNFKGVNEKQLNKQMEKFEGSVGGQSNYSYVIDFNYTNGNIDVTNVRLVAGAAPNNIAFDATYQINLAGDTNSNLYDSNFNFPLTIERMMPTNAWDANDVQVLDGNYETLSSITATAVLPYSNSAKMIKLFDSNNNLVLEKDVSGLSPIHPTIGYGGGKIIGVDYNVNFILVPQPTTKLVGNDFNLVLGHT